MGEWFGPSAAQPSSAPAVAAAAAGSSGQAGSIQPGASVYYKQGRGTFLARVVSVNARAGRATVERASDGKRVGRPLAKLKIAG